MFCDVVPACPLGCLSDVVLAAGPRLALITPCPQEQRERGLAHSGPAQSQGSPAWPCLRDEKWRLGDRQRLAEAKNLLIISKPRTFSWEVKQRVWCLHLALRPPK